MRIKGNCNRIRLILPRNLLLFMFMNQRFGYYFFQDLHRTILCHENCSHNQRLPDSLETEWNVSNNIDNTKLIDQQNCCCTSVQQKWMWMVHNNQTNRIHEHILLAQVDKTAGYALFSFNEFISEMVINFLHNMWTFFFYTGSLNQLKWQCTFSNSHFNVDNNDYRAFYT